MREEVVGVHMTFNYKIAPPKIMNAYKWILSSMQPFQSISLKPTTICHNVGLSIANTSLVP